MKQVKNLKNRILSKKGTKETELTIILDAARSFGCLGELIGREFEIRDKDGNIKYTIRQKPMKVTQLNMLLQEHMKLKKIDAEQQAAMFGKKK